MLDGLEAACVLLKQLGHMTQLWRLKSTNVRDVDEKDLCKSVESMKLVEFSVVKTSDKDEVLCVDALPSTPPLLKTIFPVGKL
ncbi:hypothetical protein ACFX12_033921 [Malus domestica]